MSQGQPNSSVPGQNIINRDIRNSMKAITKQQKVHIISDSSESFEQLVIFCQPINSHRASNRSVTRVFLAGYTLSHEDTSKNLYTTISSHHFHRDRE